MLFSALQILLSACDEELTRLGMQINEKKRRYACGLVHALTRTVKTSGWPTVARCSGHPNVGIWVCISLVDELLVALLISISAGIIKLLMQCSVKLDDLRLKKSSYISYK